MSIEDLIARGRSLGIGVEDEPEDEDRRQTIWERLGLPDPAGGEELAPDPVPEPDPEAITDRETVDVVPPVVPRPQHWTDEYTQDRSYVEPATGGVSGPTGQKVKHTPSEHFEVQPGYGFGMSEAGADRLFGQEGYVDEMGIQPSGVTPEPVTSSTYEKYDRLTEAVQDDDHRAVASLTQGRQEPQARFRGKDGLTDEELRQLSLYRSLDIAVGDMDPEEEAYPTLKGELDVLKPQVMAVKKRIDEDTEKAQERHGGEPGQALRFYRDEESIAKIAEEHNLMPDIPVVRPILRGIGGGATGVANTLTQGIFRGVAAGLSPFMDSSDWSATADSMHRFSGLVNRVRDKLDTTSNPSLTPEYLANTWGLEGSMRKGAEFVTESAMVGTTGAGVGAKFAGAAGAARAFTGRFAQPKTITNTINAFTTSTLMRASGTNSLSTMHKTIVGWHGFVSANDQWVMSRQDGVENGLAAIHAITAGSLTAGTTSIGGWASSKLGAGTIEYMIPNLLRGGGSSFVRDKVVRTMPETMGRLVTVVGIGASSETLEELTEAVLQRGKDHVFDINTGREHAFDWEGEQGLRKEFLEILGPTLMGGMMGVGVSHGVSLTQEFRSHYDGQIKDVESMASGSKKATDSVLNWLGVPKNDPGREAPDKVIADLIRNPDTRAATMEALESLEVPDFDPKGNVSRSEFFRVSGIERSNAVERVAYATSIRGWKSMISVGEAMDLLDDPALRLATSDENPYESFVADRNSGVAEASRRYDDVVRNLKEAAVSPDPRVRASANQALEVFGDVPPYSTAPMEQALEEAKEELGLLSEDPEEHRAFDAAAKIAPIATEDSLLPYADAILAAADPNTRRVGATPGEIPTTQELMSQTHKELDALAESVDLQFKSGITKPKKARALQEHIADMLTAEEVVVEDPPAGEPLPAEAEVVADEAVADEAGPESDANVIYTHDSLHQVLSSSPGPYVIDDQEVDTRQLKDEGDKETLRRVENDKRLLQAVPAESERQRNDDKRRLSKNLHKGMRVEQLVSSNDTDLPYGRRSYKIVDPDGSTRVTMFVDQEGSYGGFSRPEWIRRQSELYPFFDEDGNDISVERWSELAPGGSFTLASGLEDLAWTEGVREIDGVGLTTLVNTLDSGDVNATIAHEQVHWISAMGKWTENEWNGLVDKYSDTSKPRWQQEEDIADNSRYWGENTRTPGLLSKVKKKLKSLLNLASEMTGEDYAAQAEEAFKTGEALKRKGVDVSTAIKTRNLPYSEQLKANKAAVEEWKGQGASVENITNEAFAHIAGKLNRGEKLDQDEKKAEEALGPAMGEFVKHRSETAERESVAQIREDDGDPASDDPLIRARERAVEKGLDGRFKKYLSHTISKEAGSQKTVRQITFTSKEGEEQTIDVIGTLYDPSSRLVKGKELPTAMFIHQTHEWNTELGTYVPVEKVWTLRHLGFDTPLRSDLKSQADAKKIASLVEKVGEFQWKGVRFAENIEDFPKDIAKLLRAAEDAVVNGTTQSMGDAYRKKALELVQDSRAVPEGYRPAGESILLGADELGATGASGLSTDGLKLIKGGAGKEHMAPNKGLVREFPEFASDPAFVVNYNKNLVYHTKSGAKFAFDPKLFNLAKSELAVGDVVEIFLEDLDMKRGPLGEGHPQPEPSPPESPTSFFSSVPFEEETPIWFSTLHKAIERIPQKTSTPSQLRSWLQKQPGVKKQEAIESGLLDYLKGMEQEGKKVSKDDVLAFMETGGGIVRVEEITQGEREPHKLEWERRSPRSHIWQSTFSDHAMPEMNFTPWRIEHLQNDRFLLERPGTGMPSTYSSLEEAQAEAQRKTDHLARGQETVDLEHPDQYVEGGQNRREFQLVVPDSSIEGRPPEDPETYDKYQSPHWRQGNVVVAIRMTDRTNLAGDRILHLDEVQSDPHQEWRKRGYESEVGERGVPDLPFKGSAWKKLAMRRMIKFAADNNYDKLTWTTADMQVEMYGTTVATWAPAPRNWPAGTVVFRLGDNTGTSQWVAQPGELTVSSLTDKLEENGIHDEGRTAKKILARMKDEPKGKFEPRREGMAGFYDKELVNIANDILKKELDKDVRVETSEIDTSAPWPEDASFQREGIYREVHSVPITDKVSDGTAQGMPMYASFPVRQVIHARGEGIKAGEVAQRNVRIERVPHTAQKEAAAARVDADYEGELLKMREFIRTRREINLLTPREILNSDATLLFTPLLEEADLRARKTWTDPAGPADGPDGRPTDQTLREGTTDGGKAHREYLELFDLWTPGGTEAGRVLQARTRLDSATPQEQRLRALKGALRDVQKMSQLREKRIKSKDITGWGSVWMRPMPWFDKWNLEGFKGFDLLDYNTYGPMAKKLKTIGTEEWPIRGPFNRWAYLGGEFGGNHNVRINKALFDMGFDTRDLEAISQDEDRSVQMLSQLFALSGRKGDALYEYWRNALLSGPKTQAINVAGTASFMTYLTFLERAFSAGIGATGKMVGAIDKADQNTATFREFGYLFHDMKDIFSDAFRHAMKTFRNERSAFDQDWDRTHMLKDYYASSGGGPGALADAGSEMQDLLSGNAEVHDILNKALEDAGVLSQIESPEGRKPTYTMKYGPEISGNFGKLMRLPFRTSATADDFLKTLCQGVERNMLAARIAGAETGKWWGDPEFNVVFESQITDPASKANQAAVEKALRAAFQGDKGFTRTWLGPLSKLTHRTPGLRYLNPFHTTPLSIFDETLKRLPILGIGFSYGENRAKSKAALVKRENIEDREKEGLITKEEADLLRDELFTGEGAADVWARQAIAFGFMGFLFGTNDPDDPWLTGTRDLSSWKDRDAASAAGYEPMTIRIPFTSYRLSYARFEPFAGLLASMVDAHHSWVRHGGSIDLVQSLFSSQVAQLGEKTYVRPLSDIVEVMHDSKTGGRQHKFLQWLSGFGTSWIPNLYRQVAAQMSDDVPEWQVFGKGSDLRNMLIRRTIQKSHLGMGLVEPTLQYDQWGYKISKRPPGMDALSPFLYEVFKYSFMPSKLSRQAGTLDPESEVSTGIWKYNNSRAREDRMYLVSPSTRYQWKGNTYTMTEKQYENYTKYVGLAARIECHGKSWHLEIIDPENPTRQDLKLIADEYKKIAGKVRDILKKQWLVDADGTIGWLDELVEDGSLPLTR